MSGLLQQLMLRACLDRAGVVGPYLIGALKAKFGGYTVPMIFMTCVNSLAVVYFAILLPFLPAKAAKAEGLGAQ